MKRKTLWRTFTQLFVENLIREPAYATMSRIFHLGEVRLWFTGQHGKRSL
jgi:hypothetical protein